MQLISVKFCGYIYLHVHDKIVKPYMIYEIYFKNHCRIQEYIMHKMGILLVI